MATIGGVSLANGLVCGRSIDEIYTLANKANSTANSAMAAVNKIDLSGYLTTASFNTHIHGIGTWSGTIHDGGYYTFANKG